MQADPAKRFDRNVPGPFYSTGQCFFCGMPQEEAPDLLAPLDDENLDTYFVRQPNTPEEVEQACRAMEACCTKALRYGGHDPEIIRRLGNDLLYCDHALPGGPVPIPPRPAGAEAAAAPWWRFWRR